MPNLTLPLLSPPTPAWRHHQLPPLPPLIDPTTANACFEDDPFLWPFIAVVVAVAVPQAFYLRRWLAGCSGACRCSKRRIRVNPDWHTDPYVREKPEADAIEYAHAAMLMLPVVTISETWVLPESRVLLSIDLVFLVIMSCVCYAQPLVVASVFIVCAGIFPVAFTSWRSFRHVKFTGDLVGYALVAATLLYLNYTHFLGAGTGLLASQYVLAIVLVTQQLLKACVNGMVQSKTKTVAANVVKHGLTLIELANIGVFAATMKIARVHFFNSFYS